MFLSKINGLEWLQQWSRVDWPAFWNHQLFSNDQPFRMALVVERWSRVDQPALWNNQPLRMTNFENDQPFGIGQPFRMASAVEQWSNWCKCSTPSHLGVKFDYLTTSTTPTRILKVFFAKLIRKTFPSKLVFLVFLVYEFIYLFISH